MEDFLLRAGALADTAETIQITAQEAESILWPNTTADLTHTDSIKDLYNDLMKLKRREVDLDLHGIFISDYYRAKRIPRGFRVRNSPTIGRQNPEFCKKWIGIANKCSLDWMIIVVEEVKNELVFTKESINKFEMSHVTTLNATTSTQYMVKLQDEIMRYRNDLIRFKKQKVEKVEKVNFDYTHHQVYHWISGERRRLPFQRNRQRTRKPQFLSIDTSSADSTSETDTRATSSQGGLIRDTQQTQSSTFLGAERHTNDPPGKYQRTRRGSKDADLSEEDRGTRSINTRSKPPTRRT
ncbi:Hypothetical predicted protein [Pelobates cultripes]|uniref:Uncharacterized protein n=1 Tax=Pelobates cultripes TaxID=61616 RepID=A0AAD1VNW2_PELCU|nr:Hypothetical predicted protein [Pelobates cultripes]